MEKRLEIRNLSKSFGRKGYETQVLRNIQMDVYEGDFIAIMGPSGAGKNNAFKSSFYPGYAYPG